MTKYIRKYPLAWPIGRQKTKMFKTNTAFNTSFAAARDACSGEIKRLGGTDLGVRSAEFIGG